MGRQCAKKLAKKTAAVALAPFREYVKNLEIPRDTHDECLTVDDLEQAYVQGYLAYRYDVDAELLAFVSRCGEK